MILSVFLGCSQASQIHLAGQMRPTGRVLETPDIHKLKTVNGDRKRLETDEMNKSSDG